jgi:hypothetical protein
MARMGRDAGGIWRVDRKVGLDFGRAFGRQA